MHLGALHTGREQVVVAEVSDPARDAVVRLPGRRRRGGRLLAGVAEEDDGQAGIGPHHALRARYRLASIAGEQIVDRDGGAAEAALGAPAARSGLHICALRRPVLEDVDVLGEGAEHGAARSGRAGADVAPARRDVEVRVGDGHAPVDGAHRIRELVRDAGGRRRKRGLLVGHRRRVVDDPEEVDLHCSRLARCEEQRECECRDDAYARGPRDRLHRSPSPARRTAFARPPAMVGRSKGGATEKAARSGMRARLANRRDA